MNGGQAYVASVAIAAATMDASFNLTAGTGPVDMTVMIFFAVEWLVAFLLIAFATFVPALATAALLDRTGRSGPVICVTGALITAGLFTLLGAGWMTQPDGDPDQLTLAQAFPRYLRWTLPAGLSGGVCFWFFAYRNRSGSDL